MPLKIFFICNEEVWIDIRDAVRDAGLLAPPHSRSGMKPGLPSMVRTYNEHGGQPIRLFVVEEAMYKDGVGKLLNEQFPDVPALKFMFDPQVIHRTGPKWYAGQIRNFVANLGAPKLGAPKCS